MTSETTTTENCSKKHALADPAQFYNMPGPSRRARLRRESSVPTEQIFQEEEKFKIPKFTPLSSRYKKKEEKKEKEETKKRLKIKKTKKDSDEKERDSEEQKNDKVG